MKRIFSSALALFLGAGALYAQVPRHSQDIMLQGFYWNSQSLTGWTQLLPEVSDISKSFTMIWLPPSATGEGDNKTGGLNVGYHPQQWSNQQSCWGSPADLKRLTTAFRQAGVHVIADIVINHRAGYTGWGNFSEDNFGTFGRFQLTAEHICNTDEMNTDPNAGDWRGKATGAADTGENWGGARDLDHTNPFVQQDVEAYLKWLKADFGYDSWRYDFVKGFAGRYVGSYNAASQPYLSVGEYWDGSYDKCKAWIEATGYNSTAFDFPMKYAALNNGLAKADFSKMAWQEDGKTWRPAGLIHHKSTRAYAVTFVDNHDTDRDDNRFTGNVAQAYAFLFSSPGIPCVFWKHWTQYGKAIHSQIAARHAAGLTNESDVEVTVHDRYYEAHAQGDKGTLICRIGEQAPTSVPEGYQLAASGKGWAYYLSDNVASVPTISGAPLIKVSGRSVSIAAASPVAVSISHLSGQKLVNTTTNAYTTTLPSGTYVIQAGGAVQKICL